MEIEMKPKTITYTLAAADRNGIGAAQTPAGAGSFTLNGALVSGGIGIMDDPRRVTFYSDADESGDTYTIVGTDRYGNALTETVTGPNTTTVYSSYNYKTVTSVTTSGAGDGNIEIGSGDKAETQWIPVEYAIGVPYSINADQSSGAGFVEIEGTLDDPFLNSFNEHTAVVVDVKDEPVRAIRAKITEIDGTNGLTLKLTIICA